MNEIIFTQEPSHNRDLDLYTSIFFKPISANFICPVAIVCCNINVA